MLTIAEIRDRTEERVNNNALFAFQGMHMNTIIISILDNMDSLVIGAGGEPTIASGTSAQYWRGDKTWQTLNATAVGLGNVPNINATIATNLSSGTIPAGRYGASTIPISAINATGTPSASTILFGDGTWGTYAYSDGDKGDVTISASGTVITLNDDAVTLNHLPEIAQFRVLGRVLAGTGDISALTGSDITPFLDLFSSSAQGLAPSSGGGTVNFLRADGTWTPPGSGATLADADYGDIVVTSGGTILTIDALAVTNAKINDVAWSKITGAPSFTVDATVINGSANAVQGNAVFDELALKQNTISLGTTGQYFRGDLSLATFPTISGTNTGDVSLTGQNYITIAGQVITAGAVDLSATHVTGVLSSARISGTATNGFVVTLVAGTPTWQASSGGGALIDGDYGDIVLTGSGSVWTIENLSVTLPKMQAISTASFMGRATAGSGIIEVLTGTQATELLNVFTTTLKGLVPFPTTVTGKVLSDNGTWITGTSGTNTGDVTLAGENYVSLASQVITANAVNLSGTNVTGTLAPARIAGTATNGYVPKLVAGVPTWQPDLIGSDFFKPEDYGALGDGTTNDAAAFAAMHTAMPAAGGTILLGVKTYLINTALTFTKPFKMQGCGYHSVIKTTSATLNLLTISTTDHGHVITDVRFLNSAGSTPSAGCAIKTTGDGSGNYNQFARYTNLYIDGFYDDFVNELGSIAAWDKCIFDNPVRYGLFLKNIFNPDSGDSFISNCYFNGHSSLDSQSCIRYESSGGLKIVNTKFNANSTTFLPDYCINIVIDGDTGDFLISNCSLENFGISAIKIRLGAATLFRDIVINSNQISGYFGGPNNYIDIADIEGVSIIGNTFRDQQAGTITAVLVDNVETITLLNNYVDWASQNPVAITNSTNVLNLNDPASLGASKWDTITGGINYSGGTKLAFNVASPIPQIAATIEVDFNTPLMMLGSDADGSGSRTNNADKVIRLIQAPRTNADLPFMIVQSGTDGAGENFLTWGGGSSLVNAATHHYFYAAATTTTLTGTLQMLISTSGVQINGGSNSFVLPTGRGTSGYSLVTDGAGGTAWTNISGGGGTPGGANTQIQFNNSGSFGASANLTFASNVFTARGATTGYVFREFTVAATYYGIYPTGITPDGTNYVFIAKGDATASILNSLTHVGLNIGGTPELQVTASSILFGASENMKWINDVLTVKDASSGFVFRESTIAPSYYALYPGGVTAASDNFFIAGNNTGTNVLFNSLTDLSLAIDGTPVLEVATASLTVPYLAGSGNRNTGVDSNGKLIVLTAGTGDMILNASNAMGSSGRITWGTTTSTTDFYFKVGGLQIQAITTGAAFLFNNLHFNGTNYTYNITASGQMLSVGADEFLFAGAASGTAASTTALTEIMKINRTYGVKIKVANGYLNFGTDATSDSSSYGIRDNAGAMEVKDSGGSWGSFAGGGMTNPMTTAGDIITATSGGTPARLGLGTALHGLRVNSGGTAVEWAAITAVPTYSLTVINDADYTVGAGITHVVYRAATGSKTITLPAASSNTNRQLMFRNAGGSSVLYSVAPKYDASTSAAGIGSNQTHVIVSDGTDWWITGQGS